MLINRAMKGETAAESFKLNLWCVEHLKAHAIWFRSLKEKAEFLY